MSRQIQIRRGTANEHTTFIGADGEITVDTTTHTLRIHDGITPGGHTIGANQLPDNIDYVVEWQTPTAENNYTWYRKYASGWIEQGGTTNNSNITFQVPFTTTSYTVRAISEMIDGGVGNISICYGNKQTTKITIQVRWNGAGRDSAQRMWTAVGY